MGDVIFQLVVLTVRKNCADLNALDQSINVRGYKSRISGKQNCIRAASSSITQLELALKGGSADH